MLSIENILDIIHTESIENEPIEPKKLHDYSKNLPSFDYKLELIERPDGSLYWVE